ncbi:Uncharacterized protein YjbI, contains pentapeptide repeats [Paraburkholderia susongensis]|uniref:Uncharacterized protein YjbI, contains pentapeptide repeats n=2 Tax=Paraburkholderia susongensis TaxID=1515439 RepID=A0A1X7M551_9BURK|nr:Uncharacterized protein YjbI, contains pentapeptide repeats [Paraburkholderia susongensis]
MQAPQFPQVIKGQSFNVSSHDLIHTGALYMDCCFDRVMWRGHYLSNLRFVNCRFNSNCFESCQFLNVMFDNCLIEVSIWDDCVLRGVSFHGSSIQDAKWERALLRNVSYVAINAAKLIFDTVRSAYVSFVESEFTGVDLRDGRWTDVVWMRSQLTQVTLAIVELENFIVGQSRCKKLEITGCRGINVRWIDSRIDCMKVLGSDIKQSAWSHSMWSKGQIHGCRLPVASFDHATLSGLAVTETDLTQALFDHAKLSDSNLNALHAPGIAFRDARLVRVGLTGARLTRLDARGATLEEVSLVHSDCRAGLLIGQSRHDWNAADTREAIFHASATDDDRHWWQCVQPGARGIHS